MADVMKIGAAVGVGALTLMMVVYIGTVLKDALNDTTVNTIWGNVTDFFTNFTAKLATAGTVLGVVLIIALFAVAGVWGARHLGF